MNVLLIGGGGREHALAWKLKQSPLLDRLYCAPGNAGIEAVAECVALDVADHAAVIRFCTDNDIGLVVIGPEAPLVAGLTDDLEASGIKVFGPSRAGGAARRLQGLHQGSLPPNTAFPPPPIAASADGAAAKDYVATQSAADRGQGRRARRRQRRGHRRRRAQRPTAAIDACFSGAFGAAGDRGGDRGIPHRRGSELLRAHRRRDRAAARHRARPQARLSTATKAPTPAAWAPIRRRRS